MLLHAWHDALQKIHHCPIFPILRKQEEAHAEKCQRLCNEETPMAPCRNKAISGKECPPWRGAYGSDCHGNNEGKKKPADLAVCGLNPIQGELEETGATIPQCNIAVFFIVVISDISNIHIKNNKENPPGIYRAGSCLLPLFHPEVGLFLLRADSTLQQQEIRYQKSNIPQSQARMPAKLPRAIERWVFQASA